MNMEFHRRQWTASAIPLLILGLAGFMSCPARAQTREQSAAGLIQRLGRIEHPMLSECSGVAACRGDTNIFWMHTDGRRPVLFAVRINGKAVNEFVLDIPALHDWEDLASDHQGNLFIADTGNNDLKRDRLYVHQIAEPDPHQPRGLIPVTRRWELRFPGQPLNCECLFVWKDHAYLVSKVRDDQNAGLYRFPLGNGTEKPVVLELLGSLPVQSPITGGDISPDGQRLALVSSKSAFLFPIAGEPLNATKALPLQVKHRETDVEGVCIVADGLLVTSENRSILWIPLLAFAASPPPKGRK